MAPSSPSSPSSPLSQDGPSSEFPPSDASVIPEGPLRTGWTTGACATAATKAASLLLMQGQRLPSVSITLPRGHQPTFDIAHLRSGPGWAEAAVVKDAGDDPDITHGATIIATVRATAPGCGITFRAGPGVGTVTKPGLPIPPGEPAINPVPRRLMAAEAFAVAMAAGRAADLEITISIPNGEILAQSTWNPRLGIVGGLSVLGTTGVVIPYSCSAWIHSIQRGIDVARATGLPHVVGCVGSTSEKAARALLGVPEGAIIDMGDFVGGMLKYLRQHPVPIVTIAGGFAKMAKLAHAEMDLHSKRSQVNMAWLAEHVYACGGSDELVSACQQANTALDVLERSQAEGLPLGDRIAHHAAQVARRVLDGTPIVLHVLAFDRQGRLVGDSRAAP